MQIRKIESVTVHYATDVANLDPEKFRNLSIPYEGNSDMEFLKYIEKLGYDLENLLEELDQETQDQCWNLLSNPETPVYDSRTKMAMEWYESGKQVEGKHKNGGFETELSSDDDKDGFLYNF